MRRKVRLPHSPDTGQKVALARAEEEDADRLPPKFSLRYLNQHYCLSRCTKDEKAAFADRVRLLSQKSWAELRMCPRHGLGYETIRRDRIKSGIPCVVTDDVNIIAFRFHGLKPMVGFRSNDGTFYIVWFDRDFSLYEH